jgi:hypothetical protein
LEKDLVRAEELAKKLDQDLGIEGVPLVRAKLEQLTSNMSDDAAVVCDGRTGIYYSESLSSVITHILLFRPRNHSTSSSNT